MRIEIRDLTIGEYQDNCDECGRYEDECDELLYNLQIGSHCDEPYYLCNDCMVRMLGKMKRLLHRVEAMQEPDKSVV